MLDNVSIKSRRRSNFTETDYSKRHGGFPGTFRSFSEQQWFSQS